MDEKTGSSTSTQKKYCRNCGKHIKSEAKFCRFCGYDLASGTVPGAHAADSAPAPVKKKHTLRNVVIALAVCAAAALTMFYFIGKYASDDDTPQTASAPQQSVMQEEAQPDQAPVLPDPAKVWQLSDAEAEEYERIIAEGKPEGPVAYEAGEPMAAHDYDWYYGSSDSIEDSEAPEEDGGVNDYKSPAFSVSPVKGVTISAEEGALDKERTFSMSEVSDAEYDSLNDALAQIDDMGGILGAWELDAQLADDEVLPGSFKMEFDLSELDIDKELYDSVCAYRVDDNGKWTPYVGGLDGSVYSINSSQNSLIVIAALVALPMIPDIGTTIEGLACGAVYDPRAQSFYVELDKKRIFKIVAAKSAMAERMGNVGERALEDARKAAAKEAQKRYRQSLGYKEDQADWLEYKGKQYYRIYLKCLKEELTKDDTAKQYIKDVNELNKGGRLSEELKPIKMVIEQSREAYKYLRDVTKVKMPSDVVRIELSDSNKPAYGVTVTSYDTFLRDHYLVLYLRKFADGSTLSSEKLLLTIVHELFHIVQRGYKSWYTSNYKFDEASAQAVEWEAYDYFHEKGTISHSLKDCLENIEAVEYFAIPLDDSKTGAYPEGALDYGDSSAADRAYPTAAFIRYIKDTRALIGAPESWDAILRRYADLVGRRYYTTILKSAFLMSEDSLTTYYLDFAAENQMRFFIRAFSGINPENPGFNPTMVLEAGSKTPVALVNRNYVIRGRQIGFKPWDKEQEFGIVLRKHEGFDDVMKDYRIIPAGMKKDEKWKEWNEGIYILPQTYLNRQGSGIGVLVEADGGTAETTEGWFSDTPAGYDLYILTAPDVPKFEVSADKLIIDPVKIRTADLGEVCDSLVITLRLDKDEVLKENIPYKDWNEPWTCDLSALKLGGDTLTKEQISSLTMTLAECVKGTWEASDPCLGPELGPLPLQSTGLENTLNGFGGYFSIRLSDVTLTEEDEPVYSDTINGERYIKVLKGTMKRSDKIKLDLKGSVNSFSGLVQFFGEGDAHSGSFALDPADKTHYDIDIPKGTNKMTFNMFIHPDVGKQLFYAITVDIVDK